MEATGGRFEEIASFFDVDTYSFRYMYMSQFAVTEIHVVLLLSYSRGKQKKVIKQSSVE